MISLSHRYCSGITITVSEIAPLLPFLSSFQKGTFFILGKTAWEDGVPNLNPTMVSPGQKPLPASLLS